MDAVVAPLIAFVLVIGAAFTALQGVVDTGARQAQALAESRAHMLHQADGDVAPLSAGSSTLLGVTDVDVTVTNRGRLVYASFEDWDVVVRYEDTLGQQVVRNVPYSPSLAPGAWTDQQILLDPGAGTTELIDPGLLNPHEELVIRIRLLRTLGLGTTNEVTVTTPEGGGGTIFFDG
ncbi:MAG: hypothetical protein WD208_00675 [Dehalococcoidia bacterium]